MKKCLILLLAFSTIISAVPLEFSGSANVYAEYDTIEGVTQTRPSSTARFTLSPTVSLYGMPMTLTMFLSTEESSVRQAINNVTFSVNPRLLDKDALKVPGFLRTIKRLDIGTTRSCFSPYSLCGTPVVGGALGIATGPLEIEATGGRSQRAIEPTDSTTAAYERMLFAGKLGIVTKDNSRIAVTFLYGSDDENSIGSGFLPVYSDSDSQVVDSFEVVTPHENYLVGLNLDVSFLKGRLLLESEFVGSEYMRDTRTAGADKSTGYAVNIKPTINVYGAQLFCHYNRIDPGFYSLGAPYLINDVQSIGFGASKGFVKNQISLTATFSQERDNLAGGKTSTTSLDNYYFSIGLNCRKMPSIQIGYMPYTQINDSLDLKNRNDMFTLNVSHSYDALGLAHSTSLYSSFQNYSTSSGEGDYSTTSLHLAETAVFEFPLALNLGAGMIQTNYSETSTQTLSYDLSGTYTVKKSWTNTVGANISQQEGSSRTDLYYNTSLPLWKIGSLTFRLGRNIYSGETTDGDFKEWRITSTLTRRW